MFRQLTEPTPVKFIYVVSAVSKAKVINNLLIPNYNIFNPF